MIIEAEYDKFSFNDVITTLYGNITRLLSFIILWEMGYTNGISSVKILPIYPQLCGDMI